MRASLAIFAFLISCSTPTYRSGHLRCAPRGKQCPDSFYCASDARCWAIGAAPDMANLPDTTGDLAMQPMSLDMASTTSDLAVAAGDLAGSPSTCATALLCDGFELGALDTTKWKDGSFSGSVTVDNTHTYRGKFALHAHTNTSAVGQEVQGAVETTHGLPVTGTVYVRAWVYFPSPVPLTFDQFLNFVDAHGGGSSYAWQNGYAVNNDYGGAGYRASTTVPVPVDRWACIRFSISGQSPMGNAGDIHLYVDNQEVTDVQLLGATISQEVGLAVGMDLLPAMGNTVASQDAWFDEIIIDDKPVTCAE